MRSSSWPYGTQYSVQVITNASSLSIISQNSLNICMIMLQAAIRKFRLKKCTKSEANLTQIIEPNEIDVHDKDCDDLESMRRNEKQNHVNERSQNFSRQRIVSCPESDDLRNLSRGFDSTIFDLKRICEEGFQLQHP